MSELETTPEQIIEQDITPEEIIDNANTTIETFETKHEDCGNTVLLSTHTYDYAEIDWKDGIPPPINAANLNAMQQGIVDAQEQFDNAYTDLSLLRQDYHKFAKDSYDVALQLNQKLDAVKDTLAATDTTLGAEIENLAGNLGNFHAAVYGSQPLRQQGQLDAANGDIPYIGETLTSHAGRLQTAEGKIDKIEGLTSAQTNMLTIHGQKISNLKTTCDTQTDRLNHIESRSKIVILEYQGNDISPFNDKGYSLDQFFTDLGTNSTFACKAQHALVSEDPDPIPAVSYLPCVYKESSENRYYLQFVETIPDPVKGLHIERSISLTVKKVSDTWSCSWEETKVDSTQNSISFAPIVTEETQNVFIKKYLEDNYHSVILRYEYDNNIIHMNMTSKESDNLSCTFEGFYYSDTGVLNHIKIGWTNEGGYSDPDVTPLQQPEMNIFVAKYGVTTYNEITSARLAGALIVCDNESGSMYQLVAADADTPYVFECVQHTNEGTIKQKYQSTLPTTIKYVQCNIDDTWNYDSRHFSNIVVLTPDADIPISYIDEVYNHSQIWYNDVLYVPVNHTDNKHLLCYTYEGKRLTALSDTTTQVDYTTLMITRDWYQQDQRTRWRLFQRRTETVDSSRIDDDTDLYHKIGEVNYGSFNLDELDTNTNTEQSNIPLTVDKLDSYLKDPFTRLECVTTPSSSILKSILRFCKKVDTPESFHYVFVPEDPNADEKYKILTCGADRKYLAWSEVNMEYKIKTDDIDYSSLAEFHASDDHIKNYLMYPYVSVYMTVYTTDNNSIRYTLDHNFYETSTGDSGEKLHRYKFLPEISNFPTYIVTQTVITNPDQSVAVQTSSQIVL